MRIDARGLSCPQPVLMTKKGVAENPNGVEVLVDNMTACNNVKKFLKNAGFNVTVEEVGDEEFLISSSK
ncbi:MULTISPECIES: sulfurtransferase TusA family protein [Peptacetobacter]|uniref:sulfurtransferase TusA family protein n=1 Tax=Peptacetobacter TaxID=2743582 RepID=UPI0019170EE1|nr:MULTISPECIES: sulfurtransferase TusA family protein [Peptacetobacter]MEE0452446.1 sulfurtransferase TusA family protein [Peptacetobacter sp.]QQQ87373.1 sulfurtransferase TusA family protein [Peptacetobacter hiranonis]